ncbi:hypothetical protein STEG23_008617 [Scotinomys teguina]
METTAFSDEGGSPSLLLCLPPCVLRLTGNFYILSSWRSGVFSSCCLALDSSSSFPCPAFRAIAKSPISAPLLPCVLRLTNFYILSSWRSGVFSSCCLALDSSSSFPCPAFRAIAKSVHSGDLSTGTSNTKTADLVMEKAPRRHDTAQSKFKGGIQRQRGIYILQGTLFSLIDVFLAKQGSWQGSLETGLGENLNDNATLHSKQPLAFEYG